MNIEEITFREVEEFASNISTAAAAQLRQFIARKKEQALFRDLNASDKSDRERLSSYLEQTTLDPHFTRSNQIRYERLSWHLSQDLKISPIKLKALRNELEAAREITVSTSNGAIMIHWNRSL